MPQTKLLPCVKCFNGYHLRYAILGAVMLAVCGLVIPLILATLLWPNRSRLAEPAFSLKASGFLCSHYGCAVISLAYVCCLKQQCLATATFYA